jgi:hypothetical protein
LITENNDFNDIDYDIKCNTPGELWIRLKNHPIAFPAYVLSNNTDLSIA